MTKLRAYLRYNKDGNVIPGSMVMAMRPPKTGIWREAVSFNTPDVITTSTTTTNTTTIAPGWTPPAEWIDISSVGDNEINLLASDGVGIGFATTVASSGTYSIDWGDGTVETARASGTTYQHQYNYSGGTYCPSLGYWVYKIRIYSATGNITRWQVKRHNYTTRAQYHNILWAVFGTDNITDYSYTFNDTTGQGATCSNLQSCTVPSFVNCSSTKDMFTYCYALQSVVLPSSWGSVNNTQYMFFDCYALSSISLPILSWSNVTTVDSMFYACSALVSVTLPASWGSVTNADFMFSDCYALQSVVLPLSWGSVTTVNYLFGYCYALRSVNLPTSWGIINEATFMFNYCYSLTSVNLPVSWGSVTNITGMFYKCSTLSSIALPASWGNITGVNSLFSDCSQLLTVTLPTTWGNFTDTGWMFNKCYALTSLTLPISLGNINNSNGMFRDCRSLKYITGIEYVGDVDSAISMVDILKDAQYLQGIITIGAKVSIIGIYGASGYLLQCTGIRFTNTASTWGGSAPQVKVSYTSLDAAALNTMFTDLVATTGAFSGKVVDITGALGAATCDKTIITNSGGFVIG